MRSAAQIDALIRSRRRSDVAHSASVIGLDSLRVSRDERAYGIFCLTVRFIGPAKGVYRRAIPPHLTRHHFRITGPDRALEIESAEHRGDTMQLEVRRTHKTYEPELLNPLYTLELAGVPEADPFFSRLHFRLTGGARIEADCVRPEEPPAPPSDVPMIDYLTRDYASFRRLILDLMSQWSPAWHERSPADVGIAIIEILAYAADYLSYYQDAAAGEAFLHTARERISVRRHARLVDYRLHEGCNARVWVHVAVSAPTGLPKGTIFLSGVSRPRGVPEEVEVLAASPDTRVFESMHDARFHPEHNRMPLYTWRAPEFVLRRGATRTTLAGAYPHLRAGDAIVFESVRILREGCLPDGSDDLVDVAWARHMVRLCARPLLGLDTLYGARTTEIEWYSEDAMPFDMEVREYSEAAGWQPTTVARGNFVLCDHGSTVAGEVLPEPAPPRTYRPALRHRGLTYAVPYDPALPLSANAALKQDPRDAMANCVLREVPPYGVGEWRRWDIRQDLLHSSEFERHFAIEIDSRGVAHIRMGDGSTGRFPLPNTQFKADYRLGNGPAGNVGPETIRTILTRNTHILRVRNPRPAEGGAVPETLEHARLTAPRAFLRQERCVTEDDYRGIARRNPEVQNVALVRRTSAGTDTDYLYVQRAGGLNPDAGFLAALRGMLEPYRLLGRALYLRPPHYVPLFIVFRVRAAPLHPSSAVEAALLKAFSDREYFSPRNFTFGQPLPLERLRQAIEQVPGVLAAEPLRFEREDEYADGIVDREIRTGPAEILRLDNNPAAPQRGQIRFVVEPTR